MNLSRNFTLQELIIKHSISEEIKNIKGSLIKECLKQRSNLKKKDNNFLLETKHTNFLYNIFYQISNEKLNKFSLKDLNFKIWCYLTDKKFNETNWHNHIDTTTINSVIYLQTKDKGIFFKHGDETIHVVPNDGDILIFPSFLNHLPEVSTTEPRITLNLELRCIESPEKIFNI